jgi:two-component system chemotaxis response regulator CheY
VRILIVEDDPVSQLFMSTVLSRYGQCSMACDGVAAVSDYIDASLCGNPFELVFMDIMLPKLDGLSAIERIREFEGHNPWHVPNPAQVVVVSAKDDLPNHIRAYCAHDILSYMQKPLERADLEATMDKIVNASREIV